MIVLENEGFDAAFGPGSTAPFLSTELVRLGVLLRQYYAIGHTSLPNYLAMVSGQAPNLDTQGDCVVYTEFRTERPGLDEHGQASGRGCVYPREVPTLMDEFERAGLTWKGYMEDMGRDPRREAARCGHARLGDVDPLLLATPRDQYASKHNPFVYFHSVIDDPTRCVAHVVNLEELSHDLRSAATTPNYVFITPNLCHDGHDAPCADGEPGGLESADAFLREWVPRITHSAAFARDGLLVITFDEAGGGPEGSTACCARPALPRSAVPPGVNGPGGGRVGAVLMSPWISPGTTSSVPYNHYSLLRFSAAAFGLQPPGLAASADTPLFGDDVFRPR